MTEQIHNYKKIFFIEDVYDIEKLNVEKINLEENKIFTLSNDAHISLKQKNHCLIGLQTQNLIS